MLLYQGRAAELNPDGIDVVIVILPVRIDIGAPCIVFWHKKPQSTTSMGVKTAIEGSGFESLDTVLSKETVGNDYTNTTFTSASYQLELGFKGCLTTFRLSFQPLDGNQILTLSMSLILGDPCISAGPNYELSIFGGSVIIDERPPEDLFAILCARRDEGSCQLVSAFIALGTETAAAEIVLSNTRQSEGQQQLLPDFDNKAGFALDSSNHRFSGAMDVAQQPSSLLLEICPRCRAEWGTRQSIPLIDRYNDVTRNMFAQFGKSYTTKVWNNTADPKSDTKAGIIICTIQQSGALADNYNKGMAAAGLFVALLGVAACAAPPAAGVVVGIGGLVLAGQSMYDNFYEDPNKSRTSVLYLGDAVSRSANDRDSNEVILLRAYMHDAKDSTGVMRHMLKVTKYFLPRVIGGEFGVTDILNNPNTEVEDYFSFYFPKPHVILPRRYISIRGMRPTTGGSAQPPEILPKPSSGLCYDQKGKFKSFYDRKNRDETSHRWKDVFDGFEYSKDVRDIVTLIEGIPAWISQSVRVTNLPDERKTPVLVLENWKTSGSLDLIGHSQSETGVLKLIRNDRWFFGYQWNLTNPVGDSGDLSSFGWFQGGLITRSTGSHILFVITDKDWTYTTTIIESN